jgi:hypothetical protein
MRERQTKNDWRDKRSSDNLTEATNRLPAKCQTPPMMLQIDHRESHDVDIFLPDPQLLPFLDPKLHDFELKSCPPTIEVTGLASSSWPSPGSARSTSSSDRP